MVHKVLDMLSDCRMTLSYQNDTTIAEKIKCYQHYRDKYLPRMKKQC